MADRGPPGLKSINAAREERARGGGRYSRPSTSLLLFSILGVTLTLIGYNFYSNRKLETRRQALLEKERAVQMTVGAEWTPLRDRLEAMTMDDAKDFKGDFVDHGALAWDFRTQPGIYLRLRVKDALDKVTLRHAAQQSAHDGFTSCLLREPGAKDADAGAGPFGEQPWNYRRAMDSTKILSDEWIADVKAADDDLRMRIFEGQFEKAQAEEIPLTARIVKQAQFFLLVLDEDSPTAATEPAPAPVPVTTQANGDAAAADDVESPEMALQEVPHPTRVHLFNLKTQSEVFRLRRSPEASFVMGNEGARVTPETRAAMQRQVNNCALANQVGDALKDAK